MRLGWWTPWVDSLKLSELAYTIIEICIKYARKRTFLQYLCGCYKYNFWGKKQTRLCVSRYDQSAQNRRQKVFTTRALTFVQGGLILKIC